MDSPAQSVLLPALAVLGSIVSLALGTSFAKWLFPFVGSEGTTLLRIGFSAIILCGLNRPWEDPLGGKRIGLIALYGLAVGGMNLLFYKSLETIPFGIAVAIEFLGPLSVALLASRRPVDFLWAGCALAGIGMLAPIGATSSTLDPTGVGYVLGAAACWGFYVWIGRKAGGAKGGQAVSLGMVVAALLALPFGAPHLGVPSLKILGFGLAVALLSSAIPYSLEMFALTRLPRKTFGVLVSSEPAVAALAALVILNERLSLVQWLAVSSVIIASIGATMTAARGQVKTVPALETAP